MPIGVPISCRLTRVFPQLVSTTSATALTPGGTLTLNYEGLIAPIISAIQALYADITSIENTITGFAQSFTTHQLNADEVCLDGTCINQQQLAAVLAATNQSGGSQAGRDTSGSPSSSSQSSDASTTPDTPPQMQINGDSPAIVQIGATYNDLGATITGPQQDLNLGIQTFVNGTAMSPVQIDTSIAATDTIAYVVTDQSGLTATSTRTVIIEPAANSPLEPAATPPSDDDARSTATTPAATSTAQ